MTEFMESDLRNYHLTRLIGQGPRAEVYLGVHRYLKTSAAVKILRADIDPSTREHFLNAARDLRRLTHSHIIQVVDFGIKDDRPYLVMDYAPGGNLRQLYPEGTVVPLPTLVSLVRVIASALQYAHGQQVLHGNLKPENVLLESKSQLLLSDFGLDPSFYEYIDAPESLASQAHHTPLSASNDQYALAIMTFEWLTGQTYGKKVITEQMSSYLLTSFASLRKWHPEHISAIRQVLLKALDHDPVQRYPDVLSFASAFEDAAQVASLSSDRDEVLPQADEPAHRSSPLSVRTLPVALIPLIGREQEIETIRARLLRKEVRLLTLLGSPGIGKSRLAQALETRVEEEFARRNCFVSLASIRDPELVLPTIAHALGGYEKSTDPPVQHIIMLVGKEPFLLILDNFEQVLSAAPLLVELLSACPQLKLLVTSRASLHVQGEYEFVVPPLALPNLEAALSLDALRRVDSVALFLQRVEAFDSVPRVSERDAIHIARICIQLEGVPLALELAAARRKVLSFQALSAGLKQGTTLLGGGRQDVPAHQQTLARTIQWSYDLLTSEQQALFRRLCIFVGNFTLEAAEAVAGAFGDLSLPFLAGVGSLVDESLLQVREESGQEPQLHMFVLIRECGLERLRASGELERCYAALTIYYISLSEQAKGSLSSVPYQNWLERLKREYENLWEVLVRLLDGQDTKTVLRLASAIEQLWVLGGYLSEGRQILKRALAASLEDKEGDARRLRARALFVASHLAFRQHEPREALTLLEEGLAHYEQLEDSTGIADCKRRLGTIKYVLGEVEEGWRLLTESLLLYRQSGNTSSRYVLSDMGGVSLFSGEYKRARQCLEEGLALLRSLDDAWGEAVALHYLGFTAYVQGHYTRAEEYFEKSLALMRNLGRPYGTAEVLTICAYNQVALGKLEQARTLLAEALKQAREKENVEDVARALCGSGHLALREGDPTAARAFFEEGVAKMQGKWLAPRTKWVLATCLEGLGELALGEGQAEVTVQFFAAAHKIRAANGYFSSIGIEQTHYDHVLEAARFQLGEQTFTSIWAREETVSPKDLPAVNTSMPGSEDISYKVKPQPDQDPLHRLTSREIEVLGLLAQGLTNGHIAQRLTLSPYTVNRHVQSIYEKLGVNSRSGATRYAIEHHLT